MDRLGKRVKGIETRDKDRGRDSGGNDDSQRIDNGENGDNGDGDIDGDGDGESKDMGSGGIRIGRQLRGRGKYRVREEKILNRIDEENINRLDRVDKGKNRGRGRDRSNRGDRGRGRGDKSRGKGRNRGRGGKRGGRGGYKISDDSSEYSEEEYKESSSESGGSIDRDKSKSNRSKSSSSKSSIKSSSQEVDLVPAFPVLRGRGNRRRPNRRPPRGRGQIQRGGWMGWGEGRNNPFNPMVVMSNEEIDRELRDILPEEKVESIKLPSFNFKLGRERKEKKVYSRPSGRACPGYMFMREGGSDMWMHSEGDSLAFILLRLEGIRHMLMDEDVQGILGTDSVPMYLSEIINGGHNSGDTPSLTGLVQTIGHITPMSVLQSIARPLRLAILSSMYPEEGTMDQEYPSNISSIARSLQPSSDPSTLQHYLYQCMLIDHASLHRQHVQADIGREDRERMDEWYGQSGMFSVLGQALLRGVYSHPSMDGLSDDDDDGILSTFSHILRQRISSTPISSYLHAVGTSIRIGMMGRVDYSYMDLLPALSVGVLDIDADMEISMCRKSIVYILPDGRAVSIDNLSILSSLSLPSPHPYPIPSILHAVEKIREKIHYATEDYDWILLVYNVMRRVFRWGMGSSRIVEEGDTNIIYLIAREERLVDIHSKILLPIILPCNLPQGVYSRQPPRPLLYIGDRQTCTVGDMLTFIHSSLSTQGIPTILSPSSLSLCRTDNPSTIPCTHADQLLLSLLSSLTGADGHVLDVVVRIDSTPLAKSISMLDRSSTVNETREEIIFRDSQLSNHSVKSTSNDLINYLYTHGMRTGISTTPSPLLKGHPQSAYIPSYLLINVSRVNRIVDPKGRIDLLSIGCSDGIGRTYIPKAFICNTVHDHGDYYPVIVNWKEKMCTGYIGKEINGPLVKVNDQHIQWVILEREEIGV